MLNLTIKGAVRHVVQFVAGAAGISALQTGEGLDLAVSAAVALVTLGSFLWDACKAA